MRTSIIILSLLIGLKALCQSDETDSLSKPEVHGSVLIANIGFAPIPAFSFQSPIAMGFLTVSRNRFSYAPDLAVGFNGKPWITNQWFRYKVIRKEKFHLSAGLNGGVFFLEDENTSGDKVFSALRAATTEIKAEVFLNEKWSWEFTHWYSKGFDPGTLNGNFYDLKTYIRMIPLSEKFFLNVTAEIFYFKFTDEFIGSFFSSNILLLRAGFPVFLHFQGAQPIWTNFSGREFKWNTGFIYAF